METAPMNMKAVEMNDFYNIVQVETHKKLRPLDLTPVFSQISCFIHFSESGVFGQQRKLISILVIQLFDIIILLFKKSRRFGRTFKPALYSCGFLPMCCCPPKLKIHIALCFLQSVSLGCFQRFSLFFCRSSSCNLYVALAALKLYYSPPAGDENFL